jgi:lipopolysaccharide biosynthesis glycosyltransferase
MQVFAGFDRHYAMTAAVMLRSLTRVLGPSEEVDAHLLVLEVDAETRARIEAVTDESVQLHWHDVDPAWLEDLPVSSAPQLDYTTTSNYLVLFWDRCIPEGVERVLAIDVDVVLLESPAAIWSTDLGDRAIGAARDAYLPAIGAPGALPRWRELGLDPTAPYFNTGMLLIDRAGWRGLDAERRCLQHLADQRDAVRMMDQDALNVCLAGHWFELPLRWNHQVMLERWTAPWIYAFLDTEEIDAAIRDPALLHYAGRHKPWLTDVVPPRADAWWAVLAETPWSDTRPVRPAKRPSRSVARRLAGRVRRAGSVLLRGHT